MVAVSQAVLVAEVQTEIQAVAQVADKPAVGPPQEATPRDA